MLDYQTILLRCFEKLAENLQEEIATQGSFRH